VRLSALLISDKRVGDALAVARAGLARFPSDADLHASAATALAAKGDVPGAKSELDAAIHAAPDDPALLVTYAHWLASWKEDDAALAKLRSARAMAKDPRVLVGVAREMKALGAFGDCVPTLDRAVAIKDTPELRTQRAVCKLGAKDVEGARADLEAAIAAEYAPAHFYLARLLSGVGDWQGAVAEYEAFLKLEPNVPAAKAARESLKVAAAHARR
jgi:tetratricopeptide (TPR) repeat protein